MNDSNNKRSYGYVPPQKKRGDTHRETQYSTQKPKSSHTKTKNPDIAKIIFIIITLPFRLVWVVLKKIASLFSRNKNSELRKKIAMIIVSLGIFGFLFLTVLTAWLSRDLPDPDRLIDRPIDQSTKIYDRTGEHLLYEIFAEEKRTLVSLDEIPQAVIDGVVATEDTAFYEHHGVRPFSIIRSFVTGRGGGGASTLTQQLVKNAILTNEKKITRKIKEIILSIRLEQKYNKDQILQIYFNEIPYGSTNYGIESAAQSYFNKTVSELTLAQSATLAGLPKAPSSYLQNPDRLKTRRDFVLRRMYEEGKITEDEKNEAQAEPLELAENITDIDAPHFVLYVKQQLVELYGEKTVDAGGLKVITTLDWDKQLIAEEAVKEESEKNFEAANADNAALVAIDPKNGQVLAMVGSRDYYNDDIKGKFNVATLAKRQPGSSFKPIVYTAAFEKGYTPETVLFDVKTNFGKNAPKDYQPLNYDLQERGLVTIRKALQGSLNIPAVKTLYLVGDKKITDMVERLGYTTLSEGDFGLTLVLGGGEVIPIEHVSAYGIFANEGVKHKTISILKVEDNKGDVLMEWKQDRGERVIDKNIAATISNILSDDQARSYIFGTGSILTLPGRPVATKTGTTNNYVDGWTVGYTPSLVAGVWAGRTDNKPMTAGYGGSRVAAPIWNHFMREALKDTPVESFPPAPENDAQKASLRGSQEGGVSVAINKVTGKLASSSTPKSLIVQRTYIPQHSILHYVNKDDPRGPVPENPASDPQYQIWEDAIQDWIRRKQEQDPDWEVVFSEAPTEFDDAYSLELIPTLEVVYPVNSSTLTTRNINTDIRVSAPRGVQKVIYRLDGRYVGVVESHPFNLNYQANDLENGEHTLSIIVEDDVGNRLEENVNFTLQANELSPSLTFTQRSQSVNQNSFPRSFILNHTRLDQIKEATIYRQNQPGERMELQKINNFENLFNNQVIFTWNEAPEKGIWKLVVEVELQDGRKIESDEIEITVR